MRLSQTLENTSCAESGQNAKNTNVRDNNMALPVQVMMISTCRTTSLSFTTRSPSMLPTKTPLHRPLNTNYWCLKSRHVTSISRSHRGIMKVIKRLGSWSKQPHVLQMSWTTTRDWHLHSLHKSVSNNPLPDSTVLAKYSFCNRCITNLFIVYLSFFY